MQFENWGNAALILLVPVLAALYLYGFRRKREALAAFVSLRLSRRLIPSYSRGRQWLRAGLVAGAVVFVVLAAMKPQWGENAENVPRRGRDIVFLLDVSLSMLAEDATPNRLERAKQSIRDLVAHIRESGGHRIGLVAFAGRASLLAPLTLDYDLFLQRLNAAGPESVPLLGTAVGDAIRQSLQSFGTLDYPYTDIILVSDAEDHGSLPHAAAEAAAAHGASLYVVGVGGTDDGVPIPLPAASDGAPYVVYRGRVVQSRLNHELVRELSRIGNGSFVLGEGASTDLVRLFEDEIGVKPRKERETVASDERAERYQWFLAVAVILLAAELLVRDRRMPGSAGDGTTEVAHGTTS
tara:strand:+ start:1401 stop:2459 length:1059 start_codon:yes stop_codon:yes gene_type:complete